MLEKKQIAAIFSKSWNDIQKVPSFLSMVIIVCLFIGAMAALQAIVPGLGLKIYGTYLSWAELWQTGDAFALLATSLIHLAVPYGVLQRKSWVRPFLVFFPFFQILPFELVGSFSKGSASIFFNDQGFILFLEIAVWTILAAVYLYRSQSVCSYFNRMKEM